MGLKEQLMADYKEAMKNADTVRKDTVNMVRAAIKQHEVDQRVEIKDDSEIVKIIKKQVKMRMDALEDFAKGELPAQDQELLSRSSMTWAKVSVCTLTSYRDPPLQER